MSPLMECRLLNRKCGSICARSVFSSASLASTRLQRPPLRVLRRPGMRQRKVVCADRQQIRQLRQAEEQRPQLRLARRVPRQAQLRELAGHEVDEAATRQSK